MKTKLLVVALVIAVAVAPCFAGAVQLTGSLSTDFFSGPSAQQIVDSFSIGGQQVFWGFGWAVIPGRFGIAGDYLVSFFRGADQSWWLDWYAPALAMSFYPFGAARFFSPYIQIGLGCAGRVYLNGGWYPSDEPLLISLFPFVTGGAAFNLDGLLLGGKVTYTPYATAIPVTRIPEYPLGRFQVTLTGGFSINW